MSLYQEAREVIVGIEPSSCFREQTESEWLGPFALPVAVLNYFAKFGPVDVTLPGYGNPYFFPALSNLWQFQAGYRYHPDTQEKFGEWDDDWLVMADEGGDAFILSRSDGTVSYATHGAGRWQPTVIFASLEQMAISLAALGSITAKAGESFVDKDSYILPTHVETATQLLTSYLGDHESAEKVLSILGWK